MFLAITSTRLRTLLYCIRYTVCSLPSGSLCLCPLLVLVEFTGKVTKFNHAEEIIRK